VSGSTGPTRTHHWIYRTTARPHAWVLPKVVAALVIWASMTAVHGTWLVLANRPRGSRPPADAPDARRRAPHCVLCRDLPSSWQGDPRCREPYLRPSRMILIVSAGTGIQTMTSPARHRDSGAGALRRKHLPSRACSTPYSHVVPQCSGDRELNLGRAERPLGILGPVDGRFWALLPTPRSVRR